MVHRLSASILQCSYFSIRSGNIFFVYGKLIEFAFDSVTCVELSKNLLPNWKRVSLHNFVCQVLLILNFYLFEREKERSFILWFTPQMFSTMKTGPALRRDPGTQSISSPWVVESQLLELSPAAHLGAHQQECRIHSGAETWTQALPRGTWASQAS